MDPGVTPIQAFTAGKERLIGRFLAGTDEDLFLHEHTELLDEYFRESYARSRVGPQMRMERNPCAFVALGGYGRREQCLRSDVDLLLLFRRQVPDGADELVREIVYPLWDAGLEVGHATRSLGECLQLAGKDFEVLTSLLDARFLCGFSPLYTELALALNDRVLPGHARPYLQWLVKRNRERHDRFGDSTYLLEPNLKEGQGGLRDYHALTWMALTAYRTRDPAELARTGRITEAEFTALTGAISLISKVRNRLHQMTGRKCDRLYFEYQVELARALGFRDRGGRQAVEHCLGTLHGHMEFLKQLYLVFEGKTAPRRPGFALPRVRAARLRTRGLRKVQGTLDFQSPATLDETPFLLLKIFEQSLHQNVPLSLEARRTVRESLYLVDRGFRDARPTADTFRRILTAPASTTDPLPEMLQTGFLASFLPEMKGIVNLIQYDEYHLYPVDRHSLRTVQVLKGFGGRAAGPAAAGEDALARQLFRELEDPEPLFWAALLHDVGKGSGAADHAERGARIARKVAARMRLDPEASDRICFLVREHLALVKTATQRDIQEERVVLQFARRFRDARDLVLLYLLTVADARATGPKAWSSWIDTLLKELFFKTRNLLEKGEALAAAAAAQTAEKKRLELRKLAPHIPAQDLDRLVETMAPRYLLYTPAADILRHLDLLQALSSRPCALEHRTAGPDLRTVTVCAWDRPGLFSKIAGVFTLHNLGIHEAGIFTWGNGVALDIFTVQAPPDLLREEETWAAVERDLLAALSGELDLEAAVDRKIRQYRRTGRRPAARPDKVVVDNRESDFFTIVEVATQDRPGLLYKITRALFRCDADVRVAKIAARVDQVLDIFYVRDVHGQKMDGPAQEEALREAILKVLPEGAR